VLPGIILSRSLGACDLDFKPATGPVAAIVQPAPAAQPSAPINSRPAAVESNKSPARSHSRTVWWLLALLGVAVGLVTVVWRIFRRNSMLPAVATNHTGAMVEPGHADSTYTVMVPPGPATTSAGAHSAAGLIPHLSQWVKQKLVRRLIADRTELLGTQAGGGLPVMDRD